jgi:soluble lytic murein transglycosylase
MPRLHVLILVALAFVSLSPGPAPLEVELALPAFDEEAADDALDPVAVAAVLERLRRHATGLAPFELAAVAETVVREARRNALPVELVLAVMHVESSYHNFAVSPVGALGLMQVMPATGLGLAQQLGVPWRGPQTLFDPHVNVAFGVAYLKALERRYGRLDVALAAYNWGPGRIEGFLRRGEAVPRTYAHDVLAVYRARSASATSAAAKPSSASMAAWSPAR